MVMVEPENLRFRRSGIDLVSSMRIRYQNGERYSAKLLLQNSVLDLQQILPLIQEEATLLQACGKTQRIRRGAARWKELEKALVVAFAERRRAGHIFRRGWFERTAKRLFEEIYPDSFVKFRISQGWFNRFLSRNKITLRIVTNEAQETPAECFTIILNFLCFNRRNSQLRDGSEDILLGVLSVGRYLLSNIINMNQTPLPWEYLEGRTYEFKGNQTVWAKSRKSGWGKRQATIQLTIFADGIARVKPLMIFCGESKSKSAARKREARRYDPRVVVRFNKKAYANTDIILFWLQDLLLPVLGTRPTLLVMDLFRSHRSDPVRVCLKDNDISLSLVPGGCTGLLLPLDVSVNRPFNDILKDEICNGGGSPRYSSEFW